MNVLGVDPSMTATGICRVDGSLLTVRQKSKSVARGDWRLCDIYWAVNSAIGGGPQLAVVEDIPMNAMAAGITAQANAVAKLALMHCGVPILKVAPATLKVFATGKGNATKPDMRMAWYQRTGADVSDDNQVDAAWLRQLGLAMVGESTLGLSATHLRALDKLNLPILNNA